MIKKLMLVAVALCLNVLVFGEAHSQTATNLAILKGLAPLTVLPKSADGKAALAANFAVTGGIQTGVIRQPTLLPFADQQLQSLKDAFITDGNLAELADGLGTTLGSAYMARAHYKDREHFTNISQPMADLIAYTNGTTRDDSNPENSSSPTPRSTERRRFRMRAPRSSRQSQAPPTYSARTMAVPPEVAGADAFGDSRPFQTEPGITPISGPDYFNVPADNTVYNRGPIMNLIDSPSFPSGHTTYGYMGSLLLAVLVPERYQQMIVRASEYGNDRILMGAHYAMDVLGGARLPSTISLTCWLTTRSISDAR